MCKYRCKFFYTIPTAHNPTGRTLSKEKRKQLVELAYKYDFIIVADEVYQLLAFPGVDVPLPMYYFDDKKEKVISLGSFSKILAPALRVGWMQASPMMLKPFMDSGMFDSSGGINPVTLGIVQMFIDLGHQKNHLEFTRKELHTRCMCLLSNIESHLVPLGCTFETPLGGYFVLVKLPQGMSSSELLTLSKSSGVGFLPGTSFGINFSNYIRLSFSWYDSEGMEIGVKRLSSCVQQMNTSKGITA
eukprot:GHVR01173342.1.p1 GENE.GHVR01173342.1~~GHVR01173342.1.p1  ORF type:complete len:245 (-),score=33.02 GHVR01173342.1:151-885(-)